MKDKANKKIKSTVIVIILITGFFSIFSAKATAALNGADVAIYTDLSTSYSGVWHDGLTAIKQMLKWMGVTYEEIDYSDLNDSFKRMEHELNRMETINKQKNNG